MHIHATPPPLDLGVREAVALKKDSARAAGKVSERLKDIAVRFESSSAGWEQDQYPKEDQTGYDSQGRELAPGPRQPAGRGEPPNGAWNKRAGDPLSEGPEAGGPASAGTTSFWA